MIKLSRRNLVTLLAKLEQGDVVHAFLQKPGIGLVIAESDDIHYKDRPFGRLCPDMEEAIARINEALSAAKLADAAVTELIAAE